MAPRTYYCTVAPAVYSILFHLRPKVQSHRSPHRIRASRSPSEPKAPHMHSERRGTRPLRGRRHRAAAGRSAFQRFLDGAGAVENARRGEALRVKRHERAHSRAGRVVCRVSAAVLCLARLAPQAARPRRRAGVPRARGFGIWGSAPRASGHVDCLCVVIGRIGTVSFAALSARAV